MRFPKAFCRRQRLLICSKCGIPISISRQFRFHLRPSVIGNSRTFEKDRHEIRYSVALQF